MPLAIDAATSPGHQRPSLTPYSGRNRSLIPVETEKLFVDYAGQTVGVVDRETGEVRQAQVFGASSYTFAEGASSCSVRALAIPAQRSCRSLSTAKGHHPDLASDGRGSSRSPTGGDA